MWAAEDIPTNKLIDANPENMSNAELLSIILGSGSDEENAVELARRILIECDNKLSVLSKKSPKQLTYMRGVGKQKAAKVIAALILGKRRQLEDANSNMAELNTATRIYNHMAPLMQDLDVEEFWCLLINQNYRLINKIRISRGGISEVSVDIRIIMREAVSCNATVLAVCHNHPSGSIRPSKADDTITTQLKKACDIMRLHFLDHVIITDGHYYSYHEEGRI